MHQCLYRQVTREMKGLRHGKTEHRRKRRKKLESRDGPGRKDRRRDCCEGSSGYTSTQVPP